MISTVSNDSKCVLLRKCKHNNMCHMQLITPKPYPSPTLLTEQFVPSLDGTFNVHIPGLTHWGRMTHICISKLTIIGSENGLSPCRRQAIIWTYAGILLIRPLGTNFSEILIGIQTFSLKKMRLKLSSGKWWPFCLGHNVLTLHIQGWRFKVKRLA